MSDVETLLIHWFPSWQPPVYRGDVWLATCCPFHNDTSPSASVSPEYNAFNCFGCGMKGDVLSLIRKYKEVTYDQAVEYAASVFDGGYQKVRRSAKGDRGRTVFGEKATTGVRTNVRARFGE